MFPSVRDTWYLKVLVCKDQLLGICSMKFVAIVIVGNFFITPSITINQVIGATK